MRPICRALPIADRDAARLRADLRALERRSSETPGDVPALSVKIQALQEGTAFFQRRGRRPGPQPVTSPARPVPAPRSTP